VLPALLPAFLLLAAVVTAHAQDATLLKMRAQYAAETNPVNKAKILAKLGPREMTAIRNMSNAGDDDQALAALEKYRDAVRETRRALAATGVDASRHSGGFKELQISLRMFLRRLDDLMFSVQQDVRASFRSVRADLEADENALIDALFPMRNRGASARQ
jgi:hypothetical protein